MPPIQTPQQPVPASNGTEQEQPTTEKRNKVLRTVGIVVGSIFGILFGLPIIIAIVMFLSIFITSRPPIFNSSSEAKAIKSYLYERYGKEFDVDSIEGHGARALGDKPSIAAKAHPKDDRSIGVFLSKQVEPGGHYTDDYLSLYWSKKDRALITPKLQAIFGTVPTFTNKITPYRSFNEREMGGRVIPLEEVHSKYKDQVNYALTVDLGMVGNETTRETVSERLYQLILYMRQQVSGVASDVRFSYETQEAIHSCGLYGFTYNFIESARQLNGCWTSKTKTATRNPRQNNLSISTLEDPSLPVIFRSSDFRLAKTAPVNGASASYELRDESQSLATISVYKTGYGKYINTDRKNFPVQWLKDNIAVPAGATSSLLRPDETVMMGAIVYRVDNGQNTRSIHYAIAYKTYLIHLQAKTLDKNIDTRDKEFYLYNLINNIQPRDGFESVH